MLVSLVNNFCGGNGPETADSPPHRTGEGQRRGDAQRFDALLHGGRGRRHAIRRLLRRHHHWAAVLRLVGRHHVRIVAAAVDASRHVHAGVQWRNSYLINRLFTTFSTIF